MLTAVCPECEHELKFDSIPEIGQHVVCENCNKQLEVTWLFPLALDYQNIYDQTYGEETSGAEG